jgi:hypothetical protein
MLFDKVTKPGDDTIETMQTSFSGSIVVGKVYDEGIPYIAV